MAGIVALSPDTVFAGDYRVLRKLSEGGMGAVYVVLQVSTGRQRALKLMHPELVSDQNLRAKFEQEARIGARIESEHVVEVVAAGVDQATGTPYLVMELLVGEDLGAAVKRRGAMSPGEVALVFDQLGHAIGAAHKAGIVHRDLKPENVFLAHSKRSGAAFTIKVLDFGIAKVLEDARTSNTGAVGSPYWMAPEQTERKATVTASADVWALGLIAFYLLTGKMFWRTANDEDGTITNFLRELVLEPLPPPEVRAAELGVGSVPDGFSAWFGRCVARDPGARFADATAACEPLGGILGAPASGKHVTLGLAPVAETDPGRVATGPAHVVSVSQRGDATGDLGAARTVQHAGEIEKAEDELGIASSVPRSSTGMIVGGVAGVLAVAGLIAFLALRSGDPTPSDLPVAPSAPPVATKRCPDGMASIPEAEISIGADDGDPLERPAHKTTLNAFCMDLGEVTASEYAQCAKAGDCPAGAKTVDYAGIKPDDHAVLDAFCNTGKPGRENHPQNCVAWADAAAYCKWAQKRLPSEEEWEYAARGTDNRVYPWGGDSPSPQLLNACGHECTTKGALLGQTWQALYESSDPFETTAPTRSFEAGKSPFGVYDLEGNVSEWTASPSCPYPGNNCSSDTRTTRGGAWDDGDPREFRASARQKTAPSARMADLGFRCAK